MALDRERLREVFTKIGALLSQPTTLCLIGSAPSIFAGQPERLTGDIDVWRPMSRLDENALEQACRGAGLLFDPKGEVSEHDIYLQIINPGVVSFPKQFEPELLAQFGNLTLVMPPPSLIAAAKLQRGSKSDIDDIVWWLKERAIGLDEIDGAIASLPKKASREMASENMVLVRLISGATK